MAGVISPPQRRFMFVAGEASGDLLAAELIEAIRSESAPADPMAPLFFGAGGPRMAQAGVDLAFDLTQHAVIGLWDVLANLRKFRRLLDQLVHLALERQPDVIVCVDFSGFNRRFGHAIRRRQAEVPGWDPLIVQFVSPQVWASRPGRAASMARDFDLLLSIFPFEKPWYARHAPSMRVEFVGHPMLDRYGAFPARTPSACADPTVLLLPGSRLGELRRHLPVMVAAARRLRTPPPAGFRLVVPHESLLAPARDWSAGLDGLRIQVGNLPAALQEATVAIASTGTVTMECAFFGVPTVTLYKTNWLTYELGRRIVTVKSLTMPNLLAGETIFPEFIQHAATAENLAAAVQSLLDSPECRERIRTQLVRVIETLGGTGACRRAANLLLDFQRNQAQSSRRIR